MFWLQTKLISFEVDDKVIYISYDRSINKMIIHLDAQCYLIVYESVTHSFAPCLALLPLGYLAVNVSASQSQSHAVGPGFAPQPGHTKVKDHHKMVQTALARYR